MKISQKKLHIVSIVFCLIYFFYSVGQTIYDDNHLTHLTWRNAENKANIYSKVLDYNFEKDKVRITRKYPLPIKGINIWLSGFGEESGKVDISFYLRDSDYQKILNNEITYRKDIFENPLSGLEGVPFFGLREASVEAQTDCFWYWTFGGTIMDFFRYF